MAMVLQAAGRLRKSRPRAWRGTLFSLSEGDRFIHLGNNGIRLFRAKGAGSAAVKGSVAQDESVAMPGGAPRAFTADDLLAMGDIGPCELIRGRLVMKGSSGMEHGLVAMGLGGSLQAFVDDRGLGLVFAPGTGFTVERNPDSVRSPDASFLRASRFPTPLPTGYLHGAPDLAVEVVSPDDTPREVAEKVDMWLAHGTAVVWIAHPQQMTVEIHRLGQPPHRLTAADEICDEPLLPGFVLPLAKVFRRPVI